MGTPPTPPPPRRYTSPTGRIVIPVLLVVLLIVLVGRPILVSGLDLGTERADPVTGSNAGKKRDAPGPSRLAAPYPKACLGPASSPGLGLIASSDGSRVTAASPAGADAFALQARAPIGFSASGSFLATAGADLWTRTGAHIGIAFGRPVDSWAWSPVADCIAGIDGGRLVVAEPEKRPVPVIEGVGVSRFAFSPDGSRMVFAVDEGSRSDGIWMADLRTRAVRILQSSLGWNLLGWTKGLQPILLRERSLAGPGARFGLGFLPSDVATDCGDDIVLISDDQLTVAGITGPPDQLDADERFRYSSVACAPGGGLMLVVRRSEGEERKTSMAVLRRDGTFVREVAQQSRFQDAPMWGPPRTGVVFAGDVSGEGSVGPLVWFLPEGGTARPTGLRVDRLGEELDALLDWSATPPLGHPID